MLRKISHIILSLILLVSTMGLTIDKHYCGTRLVSVSILDQPDSCCDMADGCCHDDTDTYKLSVDYTVSQLNMDFNQAPVEAHAPPLFYVSGLAGGSSNTEFTTFIPPRKPRTTLSIIQTFRL